MLRKYQIPIMLLWLSVSIIASSCTQENSITTCHIKDEKAIEQTRRPILPDLLEGMLYGVSIGALIGVGSMTWMLYHEASLQFSNKHEGQSLQVFYWLTHVNDFLLPGGNHATVPDLYLCALLYGGLGGACCGGPIAGIMLYCKRAAKKKCIQVDQ